jgi:hypothetical protein
MSRHHTRGVKRPFREEETSVILMLMQGLLACAVRSPPYKEGEHGVWRGKAEDAKLGAVLVVSGEPLYVDGLGSWPDELRGQQIELSGTLQQRKLAPDPVVGPAGEQSAGMEGSAWVVMDPQYKLVR